MRRSALPASARDELAARLVESCVDGSVLPPHVPGEPASLAATSVAVSLAPVFATGLAALYGVRGWNEAEFERAFLRGALAAWEPRSRVERSADTLRRVSPHCALETQNARDPRICRSCRAFQEAVAREILPGRVRSVTFPRLVTRGDPDCTMEIALRPNSGGV